MFTRCHYSKSFLNFFSQIGVWGKSGNLIRDVKNTNTLSFLELLCVFMSINLGFMNLDREIEGVKRISLHLIEHPCFSGFEIFPELKNLRIAFFGNNSQLM